MKILKFYLLLGSALLVVVALTGCLGVNPGEPQALFTASPVEQVIPFTANFDGRLSYSPNGKIVSYLWDFGDDGGASGPLVWHTYEKNGVYEVRLTVFDERGIKSSTSLTVCALNPVPIAAFSYSPKSKLVDEYIVGCSEWITFDASESVDDGDIVSYGWDFGDGKTDTGKVVQHRYLWPDTYTVVLTVTDDDGGKATYSEQLRVLGGPPCGSDIYDGGNCNGDGGSGGCDGGSCGDCGDHPLAVITGLPSCQGGKVGVPITFDGSFSKGTIVRYQWDFGDGQTATGAIVRHAYEQAGRFKVLLTVYDDSGQQGMAYGFVDIVN